jgi:hypothetical protein
MKDGYTREELRQIAQLKMLAVPTSLVHLELGRHTEASIDMAWQNLHGEMHPSALMREVARELDDDLTFEGWRDR